LLQNLRFRFLRLIISIFTFVFKKRKKKSFRRFPLAPRRIVFFRRFFINLRPPTKDLTNRIELLILQRRNIETLQLIFRIDHQITHISVTCLESFLEKITAMRKRFNLPDHTFLEYEANSLSDKGKKAFAFDHKSNPF